MSARRVRSVLVTGAVLAGLVGCGDDGAAPAPAPEPGATGAPVEWRVVVATSNEPAPDSLVLQQFGDLDCAAPPAPAPSQEPTAACDAAGVKYSLEPAAIVGGIASAETGAPDGPEPVVDVRLDAEATATFAELTGDLVAGQQVALLLDGEVLAAPAVQEPVTDGRVQLTGGDTPAAASALADRLAGS